MRPSTFVLLATLLFHPAAAAASEDAIRAELERGLKAWNAGDIEGFLDSYQRSDTLRFASGSSVERGWESTRERYLRRYGTSPETMGRLAFHDLEIDLLADDAAVVFGRYRLDRGGTESEGLFTLVLRRIEDRWLVVSDHTSSAG